ncbi:hypothetical protein EDC04DRAFT_1977276 [Pisolithus marmoratus]|nr:hypothetical protein EDC04DRAFT_1977276 [Pisolithus marmoratus]
MHATDSTPQLMPIGQSRRRILPCQPVLSLSPNTPGRVRAPELLPNGWTAAGLWFSRSTRPFTPPVDVHVVLAGSVRGSGDATKVAPLVEEAARVACLLVLAGLFATRTARNVWMFFQVSFYAVAVPHGCSLVSIYVTSRVGCEHSQKADVPPATFSSQAEPKKCRVSLAPANSGRHC